MKSDVITVRLGPYMELAVNGLETIAYLNGSAPHLFIRDGSDSYRLPQGQCVPMRSTLGRLVNPFPRHVECAIGRGLPVQFGPEIASMTAEQRAACYSQGFGYRAAAADGSKYGMALMMPKGGGRAVVWVNDGLDDGETFAHVYSGVTPDFLSLRPAGFMDASGFLLTEEGRGDTAAMAIRGTYTDALAADWMAAAGVAGPSRMQRLLTRGNERQQFMISDSQAIVIVRPVNAASNFVVFVRHLGLNLEDFD